MVSMLLYKYLFIFLIRCCRADENFGWGENITKLYELISSAAKYGNDLNSPPLTRRVFVNDSMYQIHLKKLKDVNGIKMHNIVITRSGPDVNSTIYINNPLEAKLPHPFMSLEEFKDALVKQQLKDRDAFMKAKKKVEHSKIWADIKATAKLKTKPTVSKQTHKGTSKIKKTDRVLKATGKENKSEEFKNHKEENKPQPVTNNMFIKTTKANQNTLKPLNVTVRTNTLSSKVINISSASNSPFKLLAIEPTFPSSHKPSTNEAHDTSTSSIITKLEKQQVDDSNNSTTRIDEDQSVVVNKSGKSNELTSSTNHEKTISELTTIKDKDESRTSSTTHEESTSTTETTTTDEEVNDNEDTENESEDEESQYEETTATLPTTTTTRAKWSKPRVYLH